MIWPNFGEDWKKKIVREAKNNNLSQTEHDTSYGKILGLITKECMNWNAYLKYVWYMI